MLFALKRADQHYLIMNSKHYKSAKVMPFKSPFNFIYLTKQAVCAKHGMLKDDILNAFNFQQHCCLHIVITTDVT